ncbi:MAG: transglutaminase-like domain-containing protein [Elusimicrobiota bacterium]
MDEKKRKKQLDPTDKSRRPIRMIGALLIVGAAFYLARLEFIYVGPARNGRFVFSHYRFVEERWDHPRLQLLRSREKLDAVVAPGKTEFEKIVLLRKWAHDQWKEGSTFYYPPWDGVEILDLARRHRNYGFCGQYAMVFLQACLSVGLHARYVDIGHFLTEVWSDDYNRWIVMDPTNDLHYEKDGAPLRGRNLYAASWRDNVAGIARVGSDGTRTLVAPEEMQIWRNYSIILRNNHLSDPVVIEINGKRQLLGMKKDYRDYPLIGRTDRLAYGGEFLDWRTPDISTPTYHGRSSDDADDFRDVFNQTIIMLVAKEPRRSRVKFKLLAENAPGFQTFLVRANDVEAYAESGDEIILPLNAGVNILHARIKTRFGWLGPESEIRVFYKPDLLSRMKAFFAGG